MPFIQLNIDIKKPYKFLDIIQDRNFIPDDVITPTPMELVYNALVLYVIFMFYLITSKPRLIFLDDGSIKQYGSGDGKTLISLPMICVGSAVGIYFWLFIHRH